MKNIHKRVSSNTQCTHKHSVVCWLHITHLCSGRKHQLMMCITSPRRFGLKSEPHICHSARHRFSSPFNYIFIFVVAEWCVEPFSTPDPSTDPTEIEHPPYPTITPPTPTDPPSSPEAYANTLPVISLAFLCQVRSVFPSVEYARDSSPGWEQVNNWIRQTLREKARSKSVYGESTQKWMHFMGGVIL